MVFEYLLNYRLNQDVFENLFNIFRQNGKPLDKL